MSFIVKTLRLPTTTTTTTTVAPISTTTTTTLPPDPTFPISDASIFVGGFGGDEDVYSPTVPLFNEFSKIIGGGTIGDVTFTIPTNNSNYTETLSGSDFLDLDIKVVFTNNSNVESFVELPRVAIDLPYQSSGITSTFIPVNAATSVSLYTNYRLVVEFDKIIIPASGFVERFITGIVEIGTGAPSSEIINIGIGTITVGDIDIELTRAIPTGNALPIDFINILGDDVDEPTTFEIAAFQTNGTHVFSPASYDTNTGVGSVIKVNNIPVSGDTSTYLVDHANKIGYADATTPPATTTTTTTTTTAAPASAVMSFVTSGFPKSSPDVEYASGEIVQLVATTNSSNFGAVPYKIIVNTLTADNVFFSNVSENSPPVVYTIYVDQDVMDQGSVSVGNYNGTSNQGIFAQLNNDDPNLPEYEDITAISVELYADIGNNGSYVIQDSLNYEISTNIA